MCAIAFFAFLRIGEITTTSGESTNLIRITQLDRLVDKKGNVKALQLTLINYKHSDNVLMPLCLAGFMKTVPSDSWSPHALN